MDQSGSLGRLGLWVGRPVWGDGGAPRFADLARRVEALGYGALWSSGGFTGSVPAAFAAALAATERISVLTGVISVWHTPPADAARFAAGLPAGQRDRFGLGIGASHAPQVEELGNRYEKPYSAVVEYLDELDRLGDPVPPARRILAALGPRMVRLAGERSAGAHPYFVPVEHTARARALLGPGPLLAPEQAVVLESDPDTARAIARSHTADYLRLPNYTGNLERLGFGPDDLAGSGSDHLVDSVVAWGDPATVAARIRAHWQAGADHVAVQFLPGRPEGPPPEHLESLAKELLT
jgi:probable F420-dependent oxidoreductase